MNFFNLITYWLSLLLLTGSLMILPAKIAKLLKGRKFFKAGFASLAFAFEAILFDCCILYGLGYRNYTWLDGFYNLPNGFLPAMLSTLIVIAL